MIVKKCRICSNKLLNIINFNQVALSGSFLKKRQVKKEKKYSLSLAVCKKCMHVQIKNIVNPKKLFSHYEWETGISKSNIFLIRQLLIKLKKKFRLNKKSRVFEIASNDGTLLREIKNNCKSYVLGIDPAKNLENISTKKKISTIVDFFSYKKSEQIKKKYRKFDFCVARNVIAHTPNPNDIFRGVYNLLNEEGIFVIEVPHLYNIYKKNQYDNIFHEHIGFHSLKSINDLCKKNRLKVIDAEKIDSQGGSLRCYIAKYNYKFKTSKKVELFLKKEIKANLFKHTTWLYFAKKIENHKESLYNFIKKLKNKKYNISAYGASGKGQALLQICNVGKSFIDHVYDKSNIKQGKYTPGTHIKILGVENISKKKPDFLLILSWNIVKEIIKQEKKYIKNGGKFIIPFPKPAVIGEIKK